MYALVDYMASRSFTRRDRQPHGSYPAMVYKPGLRRARLPG